MRAGHLKHCRERNQFTYQWYFGTNILVGETNRVLGFPNATVGQAGSHKLYATGGGQVTELIAQLDV